MQAVTFLAMCTVLTMVQANPESNGTDSITMASSNEAIARELQATSNYDSVKAPWKDASFWRGTYDWNNI
jgi:hypothetical protein